MSTLVQRIRRASDPSTLSDELDDLAMFNGNVIRTAVARNPNASKATLSWLFEGYSADVMANPVVALYEMEAPGLQWIDVDHRKLVAENDDTLPEILEKLSYDTDVHVRWYVARNLGTPKDALDRLSKDMNAGVRHGVAWNANAESFTIKGLVNDPDDAVRTKSRERLAASSYFVRAPR